MSSNVRTWADGRGIWHAAVTGSMSDEDARKAAHRAIRRELEARDAVGPGFRLRVAATGTPPDAVVVGSLVRTFREVTLS